MLNWMKAHTSATMELPIMKVDAPTVIFETTLIYLLDKKTREGGR